MVTVPQSPSSNTPYTGAGSSATNGGGAPANMVRKMESAEQLVLDLSNPDLRENALLELSKVCVCVYFVHFFVYSCQLIILYYCRDVFFLSSFLCCPFQFFSPLIRKKLESENERVE